jgi:ribosome-associated protein
VIPIVDGLAIPDNEIIFTASRSGGPGGQNVGRSHCSSNSWAMCVACATCSEEEKWKMACDLATRMNKEGVLQVVSQRTRSQELNRADALARFSDMLVRALTPETPRIKTRVPKAAKHQRIEQKKKRALTKQTRSSKGWDS